MGPQWPDSHDLAGDPPQPAFTPVLVGIIRTSAGLSSSALTGFIRAWFSLQADVLVWVSLKCFIFSLEQWLGPHDWSPAAHLGVGCRSRGQSKAGGSGCPAPGLCRNSFVCCWWLPFTAWSQDSVIVIRLISPNFSHLKIIDQSYVVAGFWRKLIASLGANHPVVQEDQEFQQKPTQWSKELLSESKCKKRAGKERKSLVTREGCTSAVWVCGVKLSRPKADGAVTSKGTPTWVWSRGRKYRKTINLWGEQPSDSWYRKGQSTRCLFCLSLHRQSLHPGPGTTQPAWEGEGSGLGAT